ncbi:hypothetical protein D3C80_2008860 [compost metagenome]
MAVLPAVAQAILIVAEQARLDALQWRIQVGAATEQLRGAAAVLRALLDEAAGGENGLDQGAGTVGVLLDETAGAAEDLFRVVWPD